MRHLVGTDGSLSMSASMKVISAAVMLNIVLFIAMFLTAYWDNTEQLMARYTARLAFIYFLATFVASSLHYFSRNRFTIWLKAQRRYLGISFAITHTIHLAALSWFYYVTFEEVETQTLVGGGITYIFIWLMAFTSNNYAVKALGFKVWKAVHKTGQYLIWAIFSLVYFGSVLTHESFSIYHLLFILCMLAYSLRLIHYWRLKVNQYSAIR